MKENKRRTIVLIIITLATLALVIGGATYAFFATERNIGGTITSNVATAGSMYSFSASSNDSIDINIDFNEMSEANVSTGVLKTDNATLNVSVASPEDNMLTYCTYDIIWVWDSEDKYTKADVDSLPYTHSDNKVYPYEFSTKVDSDTEVDLSLAEAGTTLNSVVLKKRASIESTGKTEVKKTHVINANIYNLPVDQQKLFGKSFKAHMTIENLDCNMKDMAVYDNSTLATYIKEIEYDFKQKEANPNNVAGLYKHDGTIVSEDGTVLDANDNSYRYAGADTDVNNYVCFEGDNCNYESNLYRIISIDSNNITKVIKVTSLGYMSWNDDEIGYTPTGTTQDTTMGLTTGTEYTNIWAIQKEDGSYYTSTLNNYLNTTYLNKMEAKTDKIENTTWHVGGATFSQSLHSNPQEMMTYELDTAADDTYKGTYEAKVGLMYIYEYGFAALPEVWEKELSNYKSSIGKDWLLTEDYAIAWTISRTSEDTDRAFYLDSRIGRVYTHYVTYPPVVLPVLSLKSSTKIINAETEGVGTKSNPMIII